MDVSSYMGGNWLTQADLPAPSQIWTIASVSQQMLGSDAKICVQFTEHSKPLGCNKVNLRAIAAGYGTDSNAWLGRQLELYKDQTQFQGAMVPCIRVRIPQQQPAPAPQPTTVAPAQAQPAAPQQQQQDPPWTG